MRIMSPADKVAISWNVGPVYTVKNNFYIKNQKKKSWEFFVYKRRYRVNLCL